MYQHLLTRITQRTARIGVIGLGYVGLPLATEWARAGFHVTGIDIDAQRVAMCQQGISWIADISSHDLAALVREDRLTATTDMAVLAELDAISICVPTPLNKTKDPDISAVLSAVDAILTYLHQGQLIVLESTTYPGTTDELILPRLSQTGLTVGEEGLVFAVAEVKGPGHILFGVDASTGQIKVRRSADPAGMDPQAYQQRAALVLLAGRVYVAYGGLDGDCGNYHGWVVASRTDGQGPLLSYQVPTTREGGIWAASGPAVDSAGHVYVAVGNGETVQGNWDHSDSVLRLSATLQLEDGFAPQNWQSENASDADLGSMGPLLLPNGMIFADGKGGQGYLLRANALGGIGGQAQAIALCSAFGGAAGLGLSVFVPCTDGLRQVQVGPDTSLTPGWRAPSQVTGSPVVGGHTVYSLDPGGTLYALDATTGEVRATCSVGATSRFATPTLSQRNIFIGTMTGIVAVEIA